MKVVGLDGREYSWHLVSHVCQDPSSYHLRARELLSRLFPADCRLEELTLPGTGGLRVDFYLPLRKLLVEVQGEQHYQAVGRFHEFPVDWLQARIRDRRKRDWAECNRLRLVELPHWETEDEWQQRLFGAG